MLNTRLVIRLTSRLQLFNLTCLYNGYRPSFQFSTKEKKTKLILHSELQIQNMHSKKSYRNKEWQTIRQSKDNKFRVSLIGLPNSGKSSLFNCFIGQSLAIVDKQPGMTRDRRQYDIMEGLVKIIDTPGIEINAMGKKLQEKTLKQDMFKQTINAINESDLIIIVLDCKKPISTDEMEMIKYLRRQQKVQKIILACNKAQSLFDESQVLDQIYKLSVDKFFFCSATQGTGIFQILEYINTCIPSQQKQNLKKLKLQRLQKFQSLIKKLKQEMKQLEVKGVNLKQWQSDFRKINPNPQLNQDLDYEQFQDFLIKPEATFSSVRGTQIKNIKMKNTIKICFIGRPNVGKSSLINQILGQERLVVSDTPNTTKDSIPNKIIYKNRKIELIDTAGLQNHIIQKTDEQFLKKAQYSTMLHVRQSNVVVYVMDAYSAFRIQDFKLIRNVIQQGRPIIIAVNKWQIIKQEFRYKAKNYLLKQIQQNLGYMVHGHPIVFVSAKMNDGIHQLIDNVITSYDKWNSRISTGLLNNWLDKFKKLDNLPKDEEATLKINYLIQGKVRPPHFIFFVNNKKIFKDNYLRFLTQNIAKEFKMDGIPLRVTLRSTNNKQNEKKQRPKKGIKKQSAIKRKMEQLKKKYNNFGL